MINVNDTRGLFIWSSIIDQVRDTTGGIPLSNEGVRLLIGKYNLAQANVRVTLSDDAQQAMDVVAPALEDTVDQTVLHASAATLAAFLNAIHNSPAFVAQHQMTMSQIEAHPAFDAASDGGSTQVGSSEHVGFNGAYL